LIHPEDIPPRREAEMLLFDLAFPRDIEPEVGRLPGITLYNLEDIEAFARLNLKHRQQEVGKAEAIIEEEIEKLMAWQRVKQLSLG
jgi:glutamyl-tRNA reductase